MPARRTRRIRIAYFRTASVSEQSSAYVEVRSLTLAVQIVLET